MGFRFHLGFYTAVLSRTHTAAQTARCGDVVPTHCVRSHSSGSKLMLLIKARIFILTSWKQEKTYRKSKDLFETADERAKRGRASVS